MIKFEQIEKQYPDGTIALQNIDLSIPRGEFCVLLGHSGAGKSTLLRLVNGLVAPTKGRTVVDGIELSKKTIPAARRKASMIHQDFNLVKRSSVAVNVMTGALAHVPLLLSVLGWFPAHMRRKCCELVARVDLGEKHLYRRVDSLSGGQQQRVGIARALMLNPLVVLADEPVASLDPSASHEVLSLLRSLAREHDCTVLCSLHQVDLARRFGDRIVGLEGGHIVFDLDPGKVDQKALALVYANYDDPHGQETIKAARVENLVDTGLKRI